MKYLNLIALILVIAVNYLANALPLNDITTGALSDLYPNLFVPAGVTFSIWGLIYIMLIVLVFRRIKSPDTMNKQFDIYFIASCIANAAWIFTWHYKAVFLSWIIMLALLYSLINMFLILQKESSVDVWISRTISLYLGWISVATIASTTTLLVDLGYTGLPFGEVLWTQIVMTVAFLLGMYFLFQRLDFIFPAVIVWALIGIGIKQQEQEVMVL